MNTRDAADWPTLRKRQAMTDAAVAVAIQGWPR